MAFDKFLIAPIEDGLRRDVKPWLIPDDAFEELNNAYIFRGRLEKRIGAREAAPFATEPELATRLRMIVGTTDGAGTLAGVVPMGAAGIGAKGQMFSIGAETFTVNDDTPGVQNMLTTSATATVHTFNVTTGAYDIQTSLAATDVYWYPALPVMGFAQYERSEINDEHTYAWDTTFSYRLLVTGWTRIGASAAAPNPDIWTGDDADFFWSENYRGLNDYSYLLFTTNYTNDGVRYYDGANWTLFQPQYAANANEIILGCRLIVSFQNRLLFLNTIEQPAGGAPAANTITNRCRYSRIGSPIAANSWREDLDGEGSFIDAPTREAIVSCAKIKNRLIVFFERSTYELVYTGNQVYPFRWQEINSTLGCESTFSVVPFDKIVLGVGQTGIHACTGAHVERIDSKIPDEVFEIHNHDDGPQRVAGVRDFYNEMVYWAVPRSGTLNKYPNRLLVYNYKNDSWAFWDDSITAFGYHQLEGNMAWQEMDEAWENVNAQWDDANLFDKFNYVIAGNQEGYTFLMDRGSTTNSVSLQITDIYANLAGDVVIESINHNLSPGDWVRIEGTQFSTGFVGLNDNHYQVMAVQDDLFLLAQGPALVGVYEGAGTLTILGKVDIYSKRFNFYSERGLNTNIEKTDFYVDKQQGPAAVPDDHGELTVDYLTGASWLSLRNEGLATGAIVGTSVLEMNSYTPMENTQQRFWHAVYLQAQGESVQLRLYWNDAQMTNSYIPRRHFAISGVLFHASPTQDL